MSLHAKHLATFILGAAAGYAAARYSAMSDEENEKMIADLKAKARSFKNEAETNAQKAKEYFDELRSRGTDELKRYMADAEKMMNDLFGKSPTT